jgi:hypothetical protein
MLHHLFFFGLFKPVLFRQQFDISMFILFPPEFSGKNGNENNDQDQPQQ